MAPQSDENVKEFLINQLSPEDQLVVKTILCRVFSKEQMSCNRLADIVHGATHEFGNLSSPKICDFSAVAPLTTVGNLHCPMAIRLTRLQQELQWLHSDMMTESERNALLGQKLDDLYAKVRTMEEKNNELTRRLQDSQNTAREPINQPGDNAVAAIKRQLKRLQNDYESMTQKYCDLNISHDLLISQQEKNQKQIRKLQLELNQEISRYQSEIEDLHLKLEATQKENEELERIVKEQKQWIEVLEDRNQSSDFSTFCSESSPTINHENIGYTLLSLELEKLQGELAAQRTELSVEKQKFHTEKEYLQLQEQALQEKLEKLAAELSETQLKNQDMQRKLDEANWTIEQLAEQQHHHHHQQPESEPSVDKFPVPTVPASQDESVMETSFEDYDLESSEKRLLPDVIDATGKSPILKCRSTSYSRAVDQIHQMNIEDPSSERSSRHKPSCWTFPCSRALWMSYRGNSGRSVRSIQRMRTKGTSTNESLKRSIRRRSTKSSGQFQIGRNWNELRPKKGPTACQKHEERLLRGAGHIFTCDDEEGELFSNSSLTEAASRRNLTRKTSDQPSSHFARPDLTPKLRQAFGLETPIQRRIHLPQIRTPLVTPTTAHRLLSQRKSSPPQFCSPVRLTPSSIIRKVRSKMTGPHRDADKMASTLSSGSKLPQFNLFARRGYQSQV